MVVWQDEKKVETLLFEFAHLQCLFIPTAHASHRGRPVNRTTVQALSYRIHQHRSCSPSNTPPTKKLFPVYRPNGFSKKKEKNHLNLYPIYANQEISIIYSFFWGATRRTGNTFLLRVALYCSADILSRGTHQDRFCVMWPVLPCHMRPLLSALRISVHPSGNCYHEVTTRRGHGAST